MPRRIDISTKQGMSKWVRGITRDIEREFAKNPIAIPVEPHGGGATGLSAVSPPGSSGADMLVDRLSEIEYRALEHARALESEGQPVTVENFAPVLASMAERSGLEVALELAKGLRSKGLLRIGQKAVGDCYLTPEGHAAIQSIEGRQKDRSRRRQRSRWDLLSWIDGTTEPNTGTRVSLGDFDGSADFLPYTPDEVAAAASHLADANLIESTGGLGMPHRLVLVTEAGREHLDNATAGTALPTAASPFVKPVDSTTNNYFGPVFNNGDHAQVAVGDHNSQHQEHNVVEQVSAGYEQLVVVLAGLLQNIDSFELSEEDATDLREQVEVVRAEVVDVDPAVTPDRSAVKRGVQIIKGLLAPAWAGAQAAITTESTKGTGQVLEQLYNGNLLG